MFPRRSAITRLLAVVSVATFGTWMWLQTPTPFDDVSRDVLPGIESEDVRHVVSPFHETSNSTWSHETSNATGFHDERPADVSDTKTIVQQSHHHSNETLHNMRKNMTLLKVNNTDLKDIMDTFNKSNSKLKPDEQIKYANPHPFNYLINAENVCNNKEIFLVSYVHTAPDHYKRRMVIRQTWGNSKYYPDTSIRVVFIMGNKPDTPDVQAALYFESEQYGDIVQEDFLDSYKNLTYKGVAGLKWVSKYCSHAKYVLKSDDDIFVNGFTLLRHLKSLYRMDINRSGLLACLVWYRMKVMREGKWKIDKAEYADDYYPTYCSGSAFTMSTDVAIAMHNASYYVPFFWVDDFYITGLLPLKIGVKHKQIMSTYVLQGKELEEKFTGPQWFTYIFSHIHDLNKIQSVWQRVVELANGKQKPEVKYALPEQVKDVIAKYDKEQKEKQEKKRKEEEDRKKKKEEEEKKKKVAAKEN